MFDLKDQVAIVTGGANGIGQGIAESLAKAGARVIIADIDEDNGQKVAGKVSGDFLKLDVTDKENAQSVVEAVIEKYGKIDILAANTGVYPRSEDHTSELQSRGHLVCRLMLDKKE